MLWAAYQYAKEPFHILLRRSKVSLWGFLLHPGALGDQATVAPAPDEYRLEDLSQEHGINTALFVPFVIQRLCDDTQAPEALLTVTLRDIGEAGERRRLLRIWWSAASVPARPAGVPDHTVTEWAALGIAGIVVALYAGLHIRAVTSLGDRFDYWVDDRRREYGLEVSGTRTVEVETRHRAKVKQWRENPYGVDGYVVTVSFATRQVICSFQRFAAEVV